MPSRIVSTVRVGCTLAALGVAVVFAGEVPHELIGLNQEQVIRKLGEPRSQLQAGNRLVMLYSRERITLRDGVVIEVDVLAADPARRQAAPASTPAPAPAPVMPPVQAPVQAPIAAPVPAPSTVPMPGVVAPVVPGMAIPTAPGVAAPAAPVLPASAAGAVPPIYPAAGPVTPPPSPGVAPATTAVAPPPRTEPPPPSEPESRIGIKLVRPPSARELAAAAPTPTVPPPSTRPAATPPGAGERSAAAATPPPATPPAVRPPVVQPAPVAAPTPPPRRVEPPPADSRPAAAPPSFTALPTETPRDIVERAQRTSPAPVAGKPAVTPRKNTEASKLLRERLDRAHATTEESAFPWTAVGIGAAVLAAGVGFLAFRRRRAEAVPVMPPAREAAPSGLGGIGAQRDRTTFTADTLAKLEWKRFQEVVEAYYSKTGVVALRTRAGPQSPVHIKISWKGESQPFACVRCISQHRGTIGPSALEELLAVLDAENIRRGYVVTPGSFNAAARALAEGKQLTLMSGETLLEKLNALPESARVELMQLATAGDPTVPSCPVCEARMSLSRENPPVWRCASHPDKSFPAEG